MPGKQITLQRKFHATSNTHELKDWFSKETGSTESRKPRDFHLDSTNAPELNCILLLIKRALILQEGYRAE